MVRDLKLFRDFLMLVGGQIGSRVLAFVAFAWLARKLEPASYGAVEYVVGLSVFFALLVDGGLGVLGTRRYARDPAERDLLAFQIPAARLMIALIGIPVMAGIAIGSSSARTPASPDTCWKMPFPPACSRWASTSSSSGRCPLPALPM